MKKQLHVVSETLETAVAAYVAAKAQMEALTEQMKELRVPIEDHLLRMGGQSVVGEYKLNLAECHRENFNLKEAKLHLDMRKLKPYISEVNYTQLKITRKLTS